MDFDAIAVFVKVVQAGSFSKAARLLDLPNTTVSARVARLEKSLGVTLIQRTARKLHVTPAGRAYFERCIRGLAEIDMAEAEIASATTEPRGVLRISAPGEVAHSLLPRLAARYVKTYPGVKVDIVVANRMMDLAAEGIDLAIRASQPKDSTLVVRRFMPFTAGLWASSAYVAKHGKPETPADLEHHHCLVYSRLAREALRLSDGQHKVDVPLDGRIMVDDLETVRAFVLRGAGIGGLPEFLARDHAADGTLVRVLPRWIWAAGALFFVYPTQPFVPAKVRAFIDLALAPENAAPA